ncbi:MAG: PIG-L family deacetylase [Bryobacterales bacterium]|nr:PIG-L family deacetylase [Bryobacterales bacterium]
MPDPTQSPAKALTRRALGGLLLGTAVSGSIASQSNTRRKKILVAGGHPDDPETACGGTILRYTDAGYEAVALYLTRGEAGIPGVSHDEAARIRTAEAEKSCKIMKARPIFAGQIDGSSEVTPAHYAAMRAILEREDPDLIFTHWPVDTHADHRHCSNLILNAWLELGRKQPLFYHEVMTGSQTQVFRPTDYVDITTTVDRKHEACFAHVSQKIRETYEEDHGPMERFRGFEAQCRVAEAFIRHMQGPAVALI